MNYQEYIDLGFKRTDINDTVVQNNTGYSGFYLSKILTDRITLETYWNELKAPKMYIKKLHSDTCHILDITPEIVEDLCSNKIINPYLGYA